MARAGNPTTIDRLTPAVTGCLLATLVMLVAHALFYKFLTDDAYISFRYAENLAEGHGLVFNPGFERVEGYTNFLWVLLLALLHRLGLSFELSAHGLSLLATVGLWAAVAGFSVKGTPRERIAWACLPPLLLALTRSVAVWSTSGLETRLFEFLVVAGALRLIVEDGRPAGKPAASIRPWAAVIFALASWTRPDTMLIAGCAFGVVTLLRLRTLPGRLRWLIASALTYGGLVGAHLLFRWSYYGEWVPNTYFAKVSGRQWWEMGVKYLASFTLEYWAFLWLPFLVAGVLWHRRNKTPAVPAIFGAVVIPHTIYIASIGGDHFEYRPLDLYFPFIFLLIKDGALFFARSRRAATWTVAALVLLVVGLVALPLRSHLEFPKRYAPGFPGVLVDERPRYLEPWSFVEPARNFLSPENSLLFRLPGLAQLARAHQRLIRETTAGFVGVRQEEHALFFARASAEADALSELVQEGLIPRDTHIAVDCVGVIPYRTRLRTLDRLGLTDSIVARGEFTMPEMMAHGKYATADYAREREVDLWATENVRMVQSLDDPSFLERVIHEYTIRSKTYLLLLGDDRLLLASLPRGLEQARSRFPGLEIFSIRDEAVLRELIGRTLPGFIEALARTPNLPEGQVTAATAYHLIGDPWRAEQHYRAAIRLDPGHGAANNNLAALLVADGRLAEAVPLLRNSIREDPDDADRQVNLGRVLMATGDTRGAYEAFRRALAIDSGSAGARQGLVALEQRLRPAD